MLCRVAESVFWMSRYIERAENVARFIEVNSAIALGDRGTGSEQWAPLIRASGDETPFLERYNSFSRANVINFLLFDRDNPNSVVSCTMNARENARTIRENLSTAMWEAINRFYLRVQSARRDADAIIENPHSFLEQIKRSSHQVIGVTYATLSQGESWSFGVMGRLLERADKTSRILDVKYFILLPNASLVGTSVDVVQWSALLQSTSALQMYRRQYGRIVPRKVAEFLVLDRVFPRSLQFCVLHAEDCLRAISGTPPHAFSNAAEQVLGQLNARLNYARIDDIVNQGLHEFVDAFQTSLNAVGDAIYETFFDLATTGTQMQTQYQW
ncbi:MAG: alpha-E domain-containing protein [Planctomycetaceae bacterium]